MATRKEQGKRYGALYNRKFKWSNICVYCGVNAQCLDHVFPVSRMGNLYGRLDNEVFRREMRQGLSLVPSCNECNRLASDAAFTSILEKRDFIKEKLRRKYDRLLHGALWEAHEIESLGHSMRAMVMRDMKNRYLVEMRLNHPFRDTWIPAEVVEMLIDSP